MKIIGANICQRPTGKELLDAGACLLEDGNIVVAIAEERLTRVKHASSIVNSINYCLDCGKLSTDEVDMFVFSVCGCQTVSVDYIQEILKVSGFEIPQNKIQVCPSHHLSHAASAYYPSGFEESIILVADRDGSVLDGEDPVPYANSVEHISYYIGKGTQIELIDRDEFFYGDVGVGKAYSYVTSWLGFDGHNHAGKTMALAAYGDSSNLYPAHFFDFEENKIHCLLEPLEDNKSLAVRRMIYKMAGLDIGAGGDYRQSKYAADVARLVQDNMEEAILKKLEYLRKKTGISKLCFAGGVALNCKMNYEIYKHRIFSDIFIQPAAGDTGQCLGNALYGYHILKGGRNRYAMHNAYFGKAYSSQDIQTAIREFGSRFEVVRPENVYSYTAQQLIENKIVAWFQGRSEFGPRALGNRSILANPAIRDMKNILNARVKFRESFRPFGASVMKDEACKYFDIDIDSPYMLFATKVFEDRIKDISSVVHVDSSCRIQTVDRDNNPEFYRLLFEFRKISQIPILINTSFNIRGEPIVETPEDAIKCFASTNIDCLVLGNYVLKK